MRTSKPDIRERSTTREKGKKGGKKKGESCRRREDSANCRKTGKPTDKKSCSSYSNEGGLGAGEREKGPWFISSPRKRTVRFWKGTAFVPISKTREESSYPTRGA